MPKADAARPTCPVCGLAIAGRQDCGGCGWKLLTQRRPGPVSAEQRADFNEKLDGQRRLLDAGVVARMSADRQRYARLIRGGTPTAAEWKAARQAAENDAGGAVTDERLREIFADVLGGMPDDAETLIVEIEAEAITLTRACLDDFGSPLLQRPDPAMTWLQLLPMLAKDADERRFQLAGGFGSLDRADLWGKLAAALPQIRANRVVVICRPAGWPVLDRAAELISKQAAAGRMVRATPGDDTIGLAALLDGVAAKAPLRRGYGLMVAVADSFTKEVRAELRSLFAAGDRPGRQVSVRARRVPGDRGDVTLAVFAGLGNHAALATKQPFFTSSVTPGTVDYQISFVLDGPGRIHVTEPPGAQPQLRPWPEVLAEVPRTVETAIGPFDLVCAIDMAGPSHMVAERRALVRDLLMLLESEYPEADGLRVAVVGCTDHDFSPRQERRNVVRGAPLAAAGEALATLTGLLGGHEIYPDAAPIEDLLRRATRLLSHSRSHGRQARLLLVGQRAPHPRVQDSSPLHPCPFRLDWRAELNELTGPLAVRCVAVTDAAPRQGQAWTWRELGGTGLCQRQYTDAKHLADYLGILPATSQRVPIPLAISN